MSKVIALGPGGKVQAPERDDRFRPVIELIIGYGLLGRKVLTPACRDYEHADDTRRAIYRSCRYYCSCGEWTCTRKHGNVDGCPRGGQRIGCRADVVRDGRKKYRVEVIFRDKRETIRWVVERYGPDPVHWPYFARAKKLREV